MVNQINNKSLKSTLSLFFLLLMLSINFNVYNAARIVSEDDNQEESINRGNENDDQASTEDNNINDDLASDEETAENVELRSIDKDLLRFAKEGNLEGVKKAISAGADINCTVQVPKSIIKMNNGEIYYDSDKYFCLPESNCEYEFTPLMLATKFGHSEIVKFLLSQDDISVKKTTNHHKVEKDKDWYDTRDCLTEVDALFVAFIYKQDEIIKLLAPHCKFYRGNMYKFLIELLKDGLVDLVRILIDNLKEKINKIDDKHGTDTRYTLLMAAAKYANIFDLLLIKLLFKSKYLDINKVNASGLNSLMVAITGDTCGEEEDAKDRENAYVLKIIKLLLSYIGDLNKKDKITGDTALNMIKMGQIDVWNNDDKDSGVDEYPKEYRETQYKEWLDIVKLFFNTGRVDPTIKNKAGESFVDLVNKSKNKELLNILDKYYYRKKELTDSLFEAINKGDIKSLRKKIVTNFTVAINDDKGDTSLQLAVKINNLDIIKLLLNSMPQLINGCNNKTNDNVLHTAIDYKYDNLITLIYNAAPYLAQWPNKDNNTPIDIAVSHPLFCFKLFFAKDAPKEPTNSSSTSSSSLLLKKSEDGVKSTDIISKLLKANEALSHSENGQSTGENEESSDYDGDILLKKIKRRRIDKK